MRDAHCSPLPSFSPSAPWPAQFLERRVGAQASQDESQLRDSLKSFTDVYAVVEQNYAEPITSDKADDAIYDGAIPGMLQVLDPHSHFYDPKAYARMREDQRGRYYGVGMIIRQQNDGGKTNVYVVTPYEDTPSYRAGIHPGDLIAAIDGKSTDGWSADEVAKALKGPKGTHVQVSMVRYGQPKPLVFDLIRDEIPTPPSISSSRSAPASATSISQSSRKPPATRWTTPSIALAT